MGLLDRWNKKTTDEKLKKTDDKSGAVKAAKSVKVVPVDKSEEKTEVKLTAVNKLATPKHLSVVLRPLVTEKAAHAEAAGKYTFVVSASANKTEVINAIKNMYDITPISVNIVNVQGKNVRFGRGFGRRSDFKKAIVTLPKGKTLTIHEGV